MDTPALEPTPKIADGAHKTVEMSTSEAMDVLDEFGIGEKDYDRVMAAMEIIYGGKPEPEPPGETEDMSEQQAFGDVFKRGM